jgi:hypothetical protein
MGGTEVVIIAGGVVIIGVGVYFIIKHYCRMTLQVAASPVSIVVLNSTTVNVTLERKSWLFGSWTAVAPATISAAPTAIANAIVTGSPTSAAAPGATVTIIGAATGSTSIKVTGTGDDCTGISADLPVTIRAV